MKKIFYGAFAIAAAILSSCSLEETPLSAIPEAEAYKSSDLLYINTVGTVISGHGDVFHGTTDAYITIQGISGGEVFCPGRGGGDWQDGGKHQKMFMHTWEEDNDYMRSGWNNAFNRIAKINKAIETIDNYYESSKEKPVLDGYKYELRATRAIYYYFLLDLYGNVPICDSAAATISDTKQSSREEVFNFVIKELTESIPNLPEGPCQDASSPYYGRTTKAVAYFLLARVALQSPVYLLPASTFASTQSNASVAQAVTEKGKTIMITVDGKARNAWETVLYCQEMVASMGYELSAKYTDNFSINNDAGNVENIFVIPRDNTNYKVGDQDIQRSLHANHGSFLGCNSNWNGLTATQQTCNRFGYEYEGDTEFDPRFAASFYYEFPEGEANKTKIRSGYTYDGVDPYESTNHYNLKEQIEYGYYYGHHVWSEQDTELDARGYSGAIKTNYLKWGGARYAKYRFDATASSGQNYSNADFAIFRYADLLLMASEAKYRLGLDGGAEISAIRKRAGVEDEPSKYCLEYLCEERSRELAYEGTSRPDEIRFGNFTKSTVDRHVNMIPFTDAYGYYSDDTDGHTTLFPIPSSAMQTNPNIKQNPGY